MPLRISGLVVSGRTLVSHTSEVVYTSFLSDGWTSQATFSNSDLTATINSNGMIRSAAGASTGLRYWEITITSWPGGFAPIVGIAVAANVSTPSSFSRGDTLYTWWGGRNSSSTPVPQLYGVNEGTAYGSRMSPGDVIGVLLNNDANTLTFYRNGVSVGVAYTSLPDVEYVAWVNSSATGNPLDVTANFGATPFAYPVAGAVGLFTTT